MEKKRKGLWDSNNLKFGIENVLNRKMTIRQASQRFNVPRSTLFNKVKFIRQGNET